MSEIRVNNITNREGSAGPSVAGIPVVDSNSHFVVPSGRTGQRYVDGGENIVRDGLVLYLDAKYSYPGASGTNPDTYTWYDMSGNENHGELKNGVSYSGTDGGSLVFDGVNDYVSVPSTNDFNFGSDNFTVEYVCFYDTSTGSDNTYRYGFIFGTSGNTNIRLIKWRSGLGNGVILDYRVNGNRYCITTANIIPNPSVASTVSSPLYNVVDKWSYFTATIASNVMTLYVNSVNVGSVTLGERWNTNQDLGINGPSSSYYMKGKTPLIRVYKNKALTAEEVLQNFNATRSRYGI